ncbi:hypothetical protein [uncultured Chryseobacterium sp.]|uniref:hypothetical protein n=1 Tax=uncultured Chryseobacterium sp. TaxID=259322 RepID=UPI00374A6BE2
MKEFYIEYYKEIIGFATFVSGLFAIALKSYLTEKGKLKAQIGENKKLIEQTEDIKSKFNKELEEIKKEHQLDISKRKYQYESKKDAYISFFRLLDSFSNEQNITAQEKLKEYTNEFNRNYLNGKNVKSQNNATVVFSKKVLSLSSETYKDFQKLRQETNTIKLIASDEVIKKLQFFDYCYEEFMKISDKMMKSLSVLILNNDEEKMRAQQHEIELNGKLINNIKEELIELMRQDLNKI